MNSDQQPNTQDLLNSNQQPTKMKNIQPTHPGGITEEPIPSIHEHVYADDKGTVSDMGTGNPIALAVSQFVESLEDAAKTENSRFLHPGGDHPRTGTRCNNNNNKHHKKMNKVHITTEGSPGFPGATTPAPTTTVAASTDMSNSHIRVNDENHRLFIASYNTLDPKLLEGILGGPPNGDDAYEKYGAGCCPTGLPVGAHDDKNNFQHSRRVGNSARLA